MVNACTRDRGRVEEWKQYFRSKVGSQGGGFEKYKRAHETIKEYFVPNLQGRGKTSGSREFLQGIPDFLRPAFIK